MSVRALLILVVAALSVPGVAQAEGFGVTGFDGDVINRDGTAASQAGGHPWKVSSTIDFATRKQLYESRTEIVDVPAEQVRTIRVHLPAGFVGFPQALPLCSLRAINFSSGDCLQTAQVGLIGINGLYTGADEEVAHIDWKRWRALYAVEPPPGSPAAFAFNFGGIVVVLTAQVRPSDHGIDLVSQEISEALPVFGIDVRIWGVPADPTHDTEREACMNITPTSPTPVFNDGCSSPAGTAPKPFLRNPTSCPPEGVGLQTTLDTTSWLGSSATASFFTHMPAPDQAVQIGTTGCGELPFTPTVSVVPTATATDTPTGLDVTLAIPQDPIDAIGLSQADLKRARVTLPDGLTISPAAADGLAACGDADLKLDSNAPATCPDASKIGTVTVQSPLVDHPVEGSVYLRTQSSGDPASGDMYRMAIELRDDPLGVDIKLAGRVTADPATGRLQATFDDNPQLPFSSLTLHLKAGARAPLATPTSCGTVAAHAELTPWSGIAAKQIDSPLTIDQGCDRATRFTPALSAGLTEPRAGSSSSFVLSLGRPSGQQDLSGLDTTMPRGLLGKIAGVPQCPEAQAAAGTCSAASRIGQVQAAAGPGSSPLWVPQAGKAPTSVFLAGPYKGAPFSLSIVVPAQAGPFDLGTVIVRVALFVDPIDAHITAKADPLPTIVKGVPLRVQEVRVTLDRPGFMFSPTSCERQTIDADVRSVAAATAQLSAPFQVGDCASLELEPRLGLSLSGKGQTTDGKHPAITASLTQPGGQANLKKVRVALPLSLALDPDNANGLCEFVDGSKVEPTCPKASIVGSVTATTPILDEPLTGPVYFVKNVRKDAKSGRAIRTLPKLVIPLIGQNGVRLTLTGTSDVVGDRLVTTFDNIPDAPVSSFKMSINGGKGGILVVSGTDICKSTQIADQQIAGQNNKKADADVYMQTPSCALKVLSKTVGKRSVAVKVGGLGAGKVTVTGKGIKKTTKSIAKSTVATITAKRTKGKPGKVTVSFDPAGPTKARKIAK